ncbi:ATP-binding protein [Thermodesulfovibrio hydrogeniphilus]
MKFENRLFITFAVALVLVFSIINLFVIYFFIKEQSRYETEIILSYQELLRYDKNYPLPPFIKKTGEDLTIEPIYKEEYFKKFSQTVLIWESLFLLILMYIFYLVIKLLVRREHEYENFLKLITLILSHKIGNYLALVKTNLEILRYKPEDRIIERLKMHSNILNDEIKRLIDAVKRIPMLPKEKDFINLKDFFHEICLNFETEKKVKITGKELTIKCNREILSHIFFLLLDNSIKYAKNIIHVKIFNNSVVIRNDFAETSHGAGVGLQIVDYLCKINGFKLITRVKGDYFISVVVFNLS